MESESHETHNIKREKEISFASQLRAESFLVRREQQFPAAPFNTNRKQRHMQMVVCSFFSQLAYYSIFIIFVALVL